MSSDFSRIQDNVQSMVDQSAPAEDINGYLNQEGFTPQEFKTAVGNYGTFMSAIKRGGKSTGSLIADFLPAMGADLLGKIAPESFKPALEQYKEKQMKEAAKTQQEMKVLPAEFESYQDIKNPLDALNYAKEAVGEAIPSMLPGLVTGGAGAVLGRGAIEAAGKAAGNAASKKYLASDAAKNVTEQFAAKRAAEEALTAATSAMTKKALQVEAGSALVGSAALNMPDAYQAVYDPEVQGSLMPALASGAFNSVLDAITPFNLLRKMKAGNLNPTAVAGAWYKQGAKELGKGFLTEGATEALQEMSNAKAEQFVKGNPEFFTPENLTRFIDAGLKGGLGGGVLQGGVGALTARNAPPTPPPAPTPPAPGATPAPQPVLPEEATQGQQGELFGAPPEGRLPERTEPVFSPSELSITPEGIDTGKIQGYQAAEPLPPQAELTGEQPSFAFPGQQELFEGKAPEQPEQTREGPLKNIEGEPAKEIAGPAKPIGAEIRSVLNAAKEDPTASKILKGNNPASADIVAARLQELMPTPDADPIAAMEALYAADKSGKYPKGTKPLSEAQSELLQTVYRRLTGKDIETAIKDRALQSAQQSELFPEGGQNVQGQSQSTPGATGANVGIPGGEGNGATQGAGGVGAGGVGVGGGEPGIGGLTGGEAPKPTALNPADAWEIHRDKDQPAYADLSPEEQAEWNSVVATGRGNAVNFQDVVGAYIQRTAPAKPKTPGKTVPIPQGAVSTETNIAGKVRGLQAAQAAAWIADNGPAAYREVARQVEARLKEYKKLGFKISVRVLSDAEGARLLRSGTAGIARHSWGPGTWETKIELPPSTATFETVLHELLHSVTTPAIMYVEKGRLKGSNLSQFYKDLEEVAQYAWAELKNRVENGQPTAFERSTYRDMNNAFGSSERNRENMVREVISWSMTNPEMQAFLESIPYKGKNLFTKFVEAFRTFLGLTPKADTALSEILRATEGILNIPFSEMQKAAKEGRTPLPSGVKTANTPRVTETLTERVGIAPQTIISSPPKPLTQLQAAQTAGQKTQATAKKIYDTMQNDDFWTKFRIAALDKVSGLSKTLSSLPVFQNGQLRADMLVRSFQQVINLIKNGIQTGIPVVNSDGSVIIMPSSSNLARSQILADALDGNPIVQSSGYSGRQFVAEVARYLRGEEIQKEDAVRRAEAAKMLLIAKTKMAAARNGRNTGMSFTNQNKLVAEAKAIRNEYRGDLNINRERQVTQAHIDWAKEAIKQVPEANEILDIWRDINMGLIDLWENAGLLAEGQANYYRQKRSYVPLFASRVDLSPEQQEKYTGKGGGTKTTRELERLEGNSELLRNIWENLDKHYANMTAAAFQNQTRKIAVQQLMSDGIDAAKYAKRDNPDVNLRFKDPTNPFADNDGVVSVILDNPNDLAAFQMLTYELGPLMKGLSATTQALRAGALINPMYWIKQLIRDPIHASLVANSGIITPFHAAKEYINILANNSEEAKLLASRGVIGQVDSTIEINKFLDQVGTEKVNPSALSKMMHKVMQLHEASDAATRVAIYKKAYQEAIASGMTPADATNLAVHKARESINFSVRGNSATLNALRHMIPFFSAALTSIDTLYRAATGYGLNPEEKKAAQTLFAKRAAMLSVLSTAYAMMLQDDEDYKKLPDNVKDNNWLFPSPIGSEHTFIKIPVPFEVGFFFKTIPEVSVRYMAGTSTGKEVIASILKGIQHNLPGEAIPLPQALKPGIEAVTNYSFFTGRPIEGMSDQGLPVEFRGAHASEFAKTLSSLGLSGIGLSPAKIDHLIQGYMAELGTFTAGTASSAINAATGKEPPTKNLEQQAFFKSFLTNPNTSKAATDYYEIAHNAQETVNAFNRFKKEGRIEEAQAMVQDEDKKKLMAAAPALRRVQEQMAKIRANMNFIEQNQKIDPDTRRDEINRLQLMYDRVARQGVSLADQLQIPR
jgi:hypothetical protein